MKLTKNQTSKIIILLIIIVIFNVIFPIHSYAGFITGILTKPICSLIIAITDGVNEILNVLIDGSNIWGNITKGIDDGENFWDSANQAYYNTLMSPDKIFTGEIALLNANIFKAPAAADDITLQELFNRANGTSLAAALKKTVSNVYVILRNICAIVLLCLLIYTGIRILLASASPYEQSKWKQALIDWVKALCLLMFMHFLMVGIFYVSDLIVESLSDALTGSTPLVVMIRNAFSNAKFWDSALCIILTIMYVYITFLTIVFVIAYFKRLAWIIVLIVISPIVAVTKALGQKQGQIFDRWLREYMYTVLLQPFHMLVYYILVAVPLGMLGGDTSSTSFWNQFRLDGDANFANYGVYFYILVAITLIRPAEKFLYNLFGFNQSAVAKQGTSESGVKTIKVAEKVVKDTVNTVVSVAAAVATGGATAAAGGLPPTGGAPLPGGGDEPPTGGMPQLPGEEEEPLSTEEEPTIDEQLRENDERLNYLDMNAQKKIADGTMTDEDMDQFAKSRATLQAKRNELLQEKEGTTQNKTANDLSESRENQKAFLTGVNADNLLVNTPSANIIGYTSESDNESKQKNGDAKFDVSDAKILGNTSESDNEPKQISGDVEFNVPDAELDKALGIKNPLMDRLRQNHPYLTGGIDYLNSPEGAENINNIRGGLNEVRDTMYLDEDGGSPKEWKQGLLGYDNSKAKIDARSKDTINAFVNNKNNIEYMKKEHNLDDKKAEARLKEAAPFVNKGITDVAMIDKMITVKEEGKTTNGAIMTVVKTENVINDQSKIQAIASIIAQKETISTGTTVKYDAPHIQQEAKVTMQQARPYIEAGKKDPEILQRLVQLENRLTSARAEKTMRTPERVISMDKIIAKAMKDGMKEIKLPKGQNAADMKKLEGVMNQELQQRLEISGGTNSKTKKQM